MFDYSLGCSLVSLFRCLSVSINFPFSQQHMQLDTCTPLHQMALVTIPDEVGSLVDRQFLPFMNLDPRLQQLCLPER